MNFNELIDFNLKLLKDDLDIRPLELKNIDNEMLSDEKSSTLFKKMVSESLVYTDRFGRIQLLPRAYEIIDLGGWLKFIIDSEKSKVDIENKNLLKENLEIDLAKSNLEANKLNKEVAERNAKSERFNKNMSILNFIFVICNFGILIWQILKSAK
jgi:hypothetical protein